MAPHVHTPLPSPHGERLLAERLIELLDEKAHLWFGLHVPGGNEIDQLLVHEDIGAFVIEVKAKPLRMVLSYDLEACELEGQQSTRPPVKQAHWAMTKLRSFLSDAGVSRPPFLFATAWFPRIERNAMIGQFAPSGIAGGAMRMHFDGVLFEDELANAEQLLERLRTITVRPPVGPSPRRPVPARQQLDELVEATTGRGATVPGATVATERPLFAATPGKTQKDTVKRYLDPATRSPVVLRGYPGTGKTQALLDIAIAHAEKGRQVLFTCYNKVLATALRASLGVRDVPQAARDRLLIKDVFEIKAGLTEEDLEVYAGTFGTICVDEAQDMWGSLIEFVERLAKPGVEWFLADGTGQELYDNSREEFSPASKLLTTARTPEGGIQQQLNRQRRMSSSAATLFARGVFEKSLDQSKVSDWVSEFPLAKSEESLDIGIDEAGSLPTITTIRPDPWSPAVDAYASEITNELKLLESIGAPHDLIIMIPRLNEEHGLVRAALDELAVPYLDQVEVENRRRALPDGHIRLVTVHSARGVGAKRAILFGSHDFAFGGSKRIPPLQVNCNAGYIALTRASHGTRVVLVEGKQPSQFQDFIVSLSAAYNPEPRS